MLFQRKALFALSATAVLLSSVATVHAETCYSTGSCPTGFTECGGISFGNTDGTVFCSLPSDNGCTLNNIINNGDGTVTTGDLPECGDVPVPPPVATDSPVAPPPTAPVATPTTAPAPTPASSTSSENSCVAAGVNDEVTCFGFFCDGESSVHWSGSTSTVFGDRYCCTCGSKVCSDNNPGCSASPTDAPVDTPTDAPSGAAAGYSAGWIGRTVLLLLAACVSSWMTMAV